MDSGKWLRRLLFLLAVAVVGNPGSPRASTPGEPDPAVAAGFDGLEAEIAEVSDGGLNRGQRNSLIKKLESAEAAYLRGEPCTAASVLGAYLNEARALRKGHPGIAEHLYNRGWGLRQALLASVPTAPCADPAIGMEPRVDVLQSDNVRFVARVSFGRPSLHTAQGGGEVWTRVEVPGTRARGDGLGSPAVPLFHGLVAIPHGSNASLVARPALGPALAVNLFPAQGEAPMSSHTPDDYFDTVPPDTVFADPPFVKDERAYEVDELRPSPACTTGAPGQFRDLLVVPIECAAALYNPVTDALTPIESVDLEVSFRGGSGVFLESRSFEAFERDPGLHVRSVLNHAVLDRYVEIVAVPRACFGEELVILTAPALRPAADTLAQWKRDHGLTTSVFEVNDGAGPGPDTPHQIRALVGQRYESCTVRPSYVLLFGDAEHVPTFYEPNPVKEGVIASDFPYSVYQQFAEDWGFDFAVGRIPVDADDAQAFVDKVIGYEGDPPALASFYENASIASQFQCCQIDPFIFEDPVVPDGADQRAFIEVVENVRSRLLSAGYAVQRIYTETIDGGDPNGDPPTPPYVGDPTPRFYDDGADLPASLQPPFPWDGDTQDILDAFDAGRFLVVHLDHAGAGGWSHPHFTKTDAMNLANGERLPFVLGFNCSSGMFDNETDFENDPFLETDPTSFTYQSVSERLVRNANGGAIGVIAATRTTYGHGNIMIKGALDSAIPTMDPAFGDATPHRRMGDMLFHARLYMMAKYGGGSNTVRHWLLYNLLGDPTVRLWTASPYRLRPGHVLHVLPEWLEVQYAEEGSVITAFQETADGVLPVGRGVVKDGIATLPYVERPRPGLPIRLAAAAEGAVGVVLTPREPDPPR